MRGLPVVLTLSAIVFGCNSSAPTAGSATPSATASADMTALGAASEAPSASAGSADPDEVTLNQFFETMRTRLVARADAMRTKKYKSRAGYATDLAMMSPNAMFSDARANPTAYGPLFDKASHLLGARPDVGKRATEAFVAAISPTVEDVIKTLAPIIVHLPKADKDDCLETLRLESDDHALASALGPIVTDCMSVLKPNEVKCASDAKTRAEFDRCCAAPPPPAH